MPDLSGTFVPNISQAIHRWFRYSAGFSASWVRELLEEHKASGAKNVFDPFVGSGTTLVEAAKWGMDSVGVEAHSFVARIARAKVNWKVDCTELTKHFARILECAEKLPLGDITKYPELIHRCYSHDALVELDSLSRAQQELHDGSHYSELAWLAMASILRETSAVGTAQWTYVLPGKKKRKVTRPTEALVSKLNDMTRDIMALQSAVTKPGAADVVEGDMRNEALVIPQDWADLVLTSPPYANNYDYADSTRLELSFFGAVRGWGDLRGIREGLVRSCTQHVASEHLDSEALLSLPELEPIRKELTNVYQDLALARESHGGKKPYHAMIAAYFYDLARIWRNLRRVSRTGSKVCFVVGDSAPYGVYVPVERWLGELALNSGYRSFRFEKIRDRNIKWKNRKHRVPLKEGRLWVEG